MTNPVGLGEYLTGMHGTVPIEEMQAEEEGRLVLDCDMDVNFQLQGIPGVEEALGCRVLITMGRGVEHMEKKFIKSRKNISHTFKPIKEMDLYVNQMLDGTDKKKLDADNGPRGKEIQAIMDMCKMKKEAFTEQDFQTATHVIVWVYATVNSLPPGFDPEAGKENDIRSSAATKTKRVWLIGTRSVQVRDLLQGLETANKFEVECCHNVEPCKAIVTFSTNPKSKNMTKLVDWNSWVGSGKVRQSGLAKLEDANGISILQQTLIKAYLSTGINGKPVTSNDSLGDSFAGVGTILQVFKGTMLFTDLTDVTMERAPEIPFHLVLVFAFHAFHALGLDPETFYLDKNLNETAARFIACTIAAVVADSKQAEYYSDYAVVGVDKCTEEEFKKKPQNLAQDNLTYEYTKFGTDEFYRITLRGTEDVRQVCTARHLHNRLISDDCETSAAMIMTVFRTLMKMKVWFLASGLMDMIDDMLHRREGQKIESGILDTLMGSDAVHNFFEEFMRNQNLFGYDSDTFTLIINLAIALNASDYKTEMAVGTAKQASAGGGGTAAGATTAAASTEESLCGHCYTFITAQPRDKACPIKMVVEGTNWTIEHTTKGTNNCVKQEKDAEYTSLSKISALLCELTKSTNTFFQLHDLGKGVLEMPPDSFYKSTYVLGDKIRMQFFTPQGQLLEPHKPGVVIFGQSTGDICTEDTINDDKCRTGISIQYNLLADHLTKKGYHITGDELRNTVIGVAREETVPSWTKNHWKDFLKGYFKCEYEMHDHPPGPDDDEHHVISFTHQYLEKISRKESDLVDKTVVKFLRDGTSDITNLLTQIWVKRFDVAKEIRVSITKNLTNIAHKIQLVGVIRCMNMQTYVCKILKKDMKEVEETMMRWVEQLQWHQRAIFQKVPMDQYMKILHESRGILDAEDEPAVSTEEDPIE